jgi:hypothetical protein
MIADGLINKPHIARKVGVHVEVVEDIICIGIEGKKRFQLVQRDLDKMAWGHVSDEGT